MDAPLTMERPAFNNRKSSLASWGDEEISSWICHTKANSARVPWRLQWLDAAEETLAARATARAGV